jgi:hypothetical protein
MATRTDGAVPVPGGSRAGGRCRRLRAADDIAAAAGAGLLGLDEADERLGTVWAARTADELEHARAGLPGRGSRSGGAPRRRSGCGSRRVGGCRRTHSGGSPWSD